MYATPPLVFDSRNYSKMFVFLCADGIGSTAGICFPKPQEMIVVFFWQRRTYLLAAAEKINLRLPRFTGLRARLQFSLSAFFPISFRGSLLLCGLLFFGQSLGCDFPIFLIFFESLDIFLEVTLVTLLERSALSLLEGSSI